MLDYDLRSVLTGGILIAQSWERYDDDRSSIGGQGLERSDGRLLSLLLGAGLVAGTLMLYPEILPVVRWVIPVSLVLWSASRVYLPGTGNPLTFAAGCLLILGGFTYASYLLVPMGELTGMVAQLVSVIGNFVELFATHHRD